MKCTMHRWYFALGSIEPTVATSPAHRSPTTSLTPFRPRSITADSKTASFESAVIERYRRREQSVEKSSTDMCLAGADSYETRSVIFTSNLEFSRWGDVFGDGDMAAAVIDRIVHHGRILRFHGESYRNKHSLMK